MDAETFQLYRGTALLGTLVMDESRCAFPWFDGRFEAAPAFTEVEPLFREALNQLNDNDIGAWCSTWTQLDSPNLNLVVSANDVPVPVIVHIDGTRAQWRI